MPNDNINWVREKDVFPEDHKALVIQHFDPLYQNKDIMTFLFSWGRFEITIRYR